MARTKTKPDFRAELEAIRNLGKEASGSGDHPLSEERVRYGVAKDILLLDPREIVLEGPYVRYVDEESEEFQRFLAAVKKNKDIGQPVSVRTVGPMHERRYVLVWGMQRWRAAVLAGLERIPVRNFGTISEGQAVVLQMAENELRIRPHEVERALGFYLVQKEFPHYTQTHIAEMFGEDQGRVSILIRMGEAIALIDPETRKRLLREEISASLFQQIVRGRDVTAEERKERLLAVLAELEKGSMSDAGAAGEVGKTASTVEAARKKKAEFDQPFHHRNHRDGRTWRMRILDRHLREDPEGVVRGLGAELETELGLLAKRLQRIAESGEAPEAERARRAMSLLERLQERLRQGS